MHIGKPPEVRECSGNIPSSITVKVSSYMTGKYPATKQENIKLHDKKGIQLHDRKTSSYMTRNVSDYMTRKLSAIR